ncbi:TetR/AcrR family transcriptional regulator [Gloeobacter morelensis]|uniref:TetR/AcrR family transcriptional regulator n=1 Tax=Gloeobacter morelensis MG652769 TaxID=2781736 RepID=A0ABY3PRE1_9CYAN|nr:TetR/AcrR family transcriptional regulator [Gloeobacter morelensis]UFP96204.1 TetR/AcrR family transcriptional regulator [Gloeobacter morelensis MG652769]
MARLKNLTERGRETQRELRNITIQLILEKGYENVTVKDITERAGIDRSTFYLHYKDKQDLLEQNQKQVIDELFERCRQTAQMEDRLRIVFKHIAENAAIYRVMLTTEDGSALYLRMHDYIVEQLRTVMQERVAQQGLTPDVPLEMLANYYTGALRGAAVWWLAQGMPCPPEQMVRLFQRLMLQGISAVGGPPVRPEA